VVASLPVSTQDDYQIGLHLLQTFVSPLDDVTPLAFFLNTQNTMGCPVASGDALTFTVQNPETGATAQIGPITVKAP